MDDKTEQLRDIFLDVADDDTVTESQREGRGSLVADEGSVDERLQSVIEQLREKFGVEAGLDDEALYQVVRAFYAGEDDAAIADDLGRDVETVFRARMDMHLVRDGDLPSGRLEEAVRTVEAPPGDLDAATVGRLADECRVDERAVERAGAAIAAVGRSRRVSHRFRTAFEETLTDLDLTVRFTDDAHEDGLEGATADAEVDVEL